MFVVRLVRCCANIALHPHFSSAGAVVPDTTLVVGVPPCVRLQAAMTTFPAPAVSHGVDRVLAAEWDRFSARPDGHTACIASPRDGQGCRLSRARRPRRLLRLADCHCCPSAHTVVMVDASTASAVHAAQTILGSVEGRTCSGEELTGLTVDLAKAMLSLCECNTTSRDREQAEVLGRMMTDRRGQVFTTALTDRAYRSSSLKRAVEQARYLLEKIGPPSYLGPLERLSLTALRRVGTWVPTLSGTAMLNRIEQETSAFVLPAGKELDAYLARRGRDGTQVNVNHLGEEVLGETEAERRVQGYVSLLARPGVETLSVKVSSIDSQLSVVAFDAGVRRVSERLRTIYHAALEHRRRDGRPKLVMLDMEAYRDARLTLAAFKEALDSSDLLELTAGIALQAYLPDTVQWHAELLTWARRRRARGGAPIRTRLVKGANLAVETVESNLHGWPNPIYPSKLDVDANYKRLLLTACQADNVDAVQVGVGSHNLFDVCYALLLRVQNGVSAGVAFELLEGMAEPLRRSLEQVGAPTLVYAPIVEEHEFPSAIAYLVRRLDENTAPENYLAQSFSMRAGSRAWSEQESRFRASCKHIEHVSSEARRVQDRSAIEPGLSLTEDFDNEPDTDFSLPVNLRLFQGWLEKTQAAQFEVRSLIAGEAADSNVRRDGFDPSRPGYVPYEVHLASSNDVERALECASRTHLQGPPASEVRQRWLSEAAKGLRMARAELVSLMVLDSGKRIEEADIEVSEAIDFAEYYLRSQRALEQDATVRVEPRGLVVITPPWNFPLAIPMGGVFAALAAGDPAIIKPALETPLVVQRACEVLWQAGVPPQWLQLVVCEDETASQLVRDTRTRAVILTGATSTAELFLDMRPGLSLFAETGGKNALYVSAMSDHEQAIADVVASAFGHAGQKCSALSQLILDRELYRDDTFIETFADATRSLRVGSAWDPQTFVTPLIHPPSELQRRALTQLEPGERWLVEPQLDSDNPRLVSPGVKLGVRPGSFTHRTEFFCPLIGVLEAADVGRALEIANGTPYGLTAGIHSLDEREQDVFIDGIQAGNIYVNRRITGAVVRRQAFGGWKKSSFGAGAKAGGPNYVAQLSQLHDAARSGGAYQAGARAGLPDRVRRVVERLVELAPALESDRLWDLAADFTEVHTQEFASGYDASRLLGEDNLFRYRPLRGLVLIVTAATSAWDMALTALAAVVAECPLEVLSVSDVIEADAERLPLFRALAGRAVPDPDALLEHLEVTGAERIRHVGPPNERLLRLAHRRGIHLIWERPLSAPRWELLHYTREQAVSVRFHRYGHLGFREGR